jgi:hypothetical protein
MMMRELDIMLGLTDQEWSVPYGDEPEVAETQEEVSRVYARAPRGFLTSIKDWLLRRERVHT